MIEKFSRHVTSGNFMEKVESKVKANRITMELERKQPRKALRKERQSDRMSLTPGKQKSIIEEESSPSNSVSSCSSSSDLVEDQEELDKLTLKNKAAASSSKVNPYMRAMASKHALR